MRDGHFSPPDGVRPGQIGTLVDEQADVVDVTATIVDLAVRGYLRIDEQERQTYDAPDWMLVKQPHAPVTALLPYERALYDAIFDGRDAVLLSQLSGSFVAHLGKVRDALYTDVVRQGWFARRPDAERTRWTTIGVVAMVVGIVATAALAWFTTYGLIGLALIIAGGALSVGGQYMPAKTAKGSAALAHTLGFREFLFSGDLGDVPEKQRVELFSRYLPYAVIFDGVEHWSRVVASVTGNGPPPTTSTGTTGRPSGTCRSSPARCVRSPRRPRARSRPPASSAPSSGHAPAPSLTRSPTLADASLADRAAAAQHGLRGQRVQLGRGEPERAQRRHGERGTPAPGAVLDLDDSGAPVLEHERLEALRPGLDQQTGQGAHESRLRPVSAGRPLRMLPHRIENTPRPHAPFRAPLRTALRARFRAALRAVGGPGGALRAVGGPGAALRGQREGGECSGHAQHRDEEQWRPAPVHPGGETRSPVSSSTVARIARCSGCGGSRYVSSGQSLRTQVASMAACLPEQFM